MPLFSLDRSPTLVNRPYSAQRAMRLAGLAGAGSLLAAVGIVVSGGGSSAESATPARPIDTVAGAADSPVPSTVALETSITVSAVAATTTTTTAVAPVCTNTYTVVSGDYWTLIGNEAAVSLDVLYAVNGASADTALFPGQTVCLPDGATVVVPTTQATTPVTTPATTQAAASKTTAAAPAPVATTPSSGSHSSG